MNTYCESCLMPFAKDPGTRESDRYCSLCFHDGRLSYGGTDLKEFQRMCRVSMRARGVNPFLAWLYTFLIRFAPRWKDKK
jgi:hypothetical protein